ACLGVSHSHPLTPTAKHNYTRSGTGIKGIKRCRRRTLAKMATTTGSAISISIIVICVKPGSLGATTFLITGPVCDRKRRLPRVGQVWRYDLIDRRLGRGSGDGCDFLITADRLCYVTPSVSAKAFRAGGFRFMALSETCRLR